MRMRALLCLASVSTGVFASSVAGAQPTADAWAEYAADPDRHPNIPNVSHAGWDGGGVPLPDGSGTVLLAVTTFGAVGDGVTDDTAAVRAAIADAIAQAGSQPNGATVLFPPGTYKLSGPLLIHGDKVQLRGLDRDTTTLLFTESLQSSYAVFPGNDPGESNWSFTGGMVWFCHESRNPYFSGVPTISTTDNGFRFTGTQNILGGALLGDRTVTVSNAGIYSPGETIAIEINNASDLSTLRHLLGDGTWANNYMFTSARDGSILPSSRSSFRVYHTIESIDGNEITLREPARFDLRPEWDPEIRTIERVRRDVGIARLTIKLERDYEWTRGDWHGKEPGFNGISFTDTINGFVDDVKIIDPGGLAVFMNYCKNVTVNGVVVEASLPEMTRHHHAFGFANSTDSIYQNFEVTSRPNHGVYVGNFCVNNVYSNGTLAGGTFDYHRLLPYANVYTQIEIINDGDAGGASTSGPAMGARHTHWNVNLKRSSSRWTAQPDLMPMGALVGIQCAVPTDPNNAENGDSQAMIEDVALDASVPSPANLYEAQIALRLGGSIPSDGGTDGECAECSVDHPYAFDFGGTLNTVLTGQDGWELSRDFSEIDGENTFLQTDATYPGGAVVAAVNRNGRDSIITRQNGSGFAFTPHLSSDTDARIRFDARAGISGGASGNVFLIVNNTASLAEGIQFGMTPTAFQVRGGLFSNVLNESVSIPSGWYARGDWARLELRVDFTANAGEGEASLYFMNLSDGDTEFRAVPGLQGVPMQGEVIYPETWDEIGFRIRNASAATNIVANVGAAGISCCPADWNGDGLLTNEGDTLGVIAAIDAGDPEADFDEDDEVNFLDMLGFLRSFDEGCD